MEGTSFLGLLNHPAWRSVGDLRSTLKGTGFVRRYLRLQTKVVELMGNDPMHGTNRVRLGL